jgi:hypothetical protein
LNSCARLVGCTVILSSDWRRYKDARTFAIQILERFGVKIKGHTPIIRGTVVRPLEIVQWLKRFAKDKLHAFVAVDDRSLLLEDGGHFLKSGSRDRLGCEHVHRWPYFCGAFQWRLVFDSRRRKRAYAQGLVWLIHRTQSRPIRPNQTADWPEPSRSGPVHRAAEYGTCCRRVMVGFRLRRKLGPR